MFRSLQQFQKANDVFAVEAARRWAARGVTINVMSPGLVNTRIRREAGPLKIADLVLKPFMRKPESAAADVLTLLLDPGLAAATPRRGAAAKDPKSHTAARDVPATPPWS